MNGRLLGLLACLLAFPWSAPALAWGDFGHRIICEIAFQELDASARERVKALIRRDPEFSTFAESCSWPDRPRRRAMEHFVNLPREAIAFGDDPCPLADECVVSAIEKDLAVLSSSSATEQERLEALKYLGHWVGDVHQPLHVAFEDDRGGNGVGVAGGLCSWSLHAVWDGCVIQQDLQGDARSIARGGHRQGTGGVACLHAGRMGERVVPGRDQPGGRVLHPHRRRVLVQRGQRAPGRGGPEKNGPGGPGLPRDPRPDRSGAAGEGRRQA